MVTVSVEQVWVRLVMSNALWREAGLGWPTKPLPIHNPVGRHIDGGDRSARRPIPLR
jgi:hypothetical protein